jgi:hypothetical protein
MPRINVPAQPVAQHLNSGFGPYIYRECHVNPRRNALAVRWVAEPPTSGCAVGYVLPMVATLSDQI